MLFLNAMVIPPRQVTTEQRFIFLATDIGSSCEISLITIGPTKKLKWFNLNEKLVWEN